MNNPVGIFYTYYPFEGGVEWERCLTRAAEAGADSIEVSTMRLVRESEALCDRVAALAKNLGIQLSFTTGFPGNCDMSSDDPDERARAVAFMTKNIQLVRRMGGHQLGAVYHGLNRIPRRQEFSRKEKRLDNAVLAVRELAKAAEYYDVILADEAVNRFESETINTVDEELVFLDRVNSPNVLALLDTFHMNIEEDDIPAAIRRAGKRIAHMHLAENNRKLPGNGALRWKEILAAVRETGYSGFLTMESFQEPYPAISDSMCIWRDMRTNGTDEDVRNAVAYLKELMKAI